MNTIHISRLLCLMVAVLATSTLSGCADRDTPPPVQRLVDAFVPEMVADSPPPDADRPEPTVFRFDGAEDVGADPSSSAIRGWERVRHLTDLAVRDGRLRGTTSGASPLLRLRRTPGAGEEDLLHKVEVRMKVSRLPPSGGTSAEGEIQMHLFGAEETDFDRLVLTNPQVALPMTVPLVAGDEVRTYELTSILTLRGADIHSVVLCPVNVAGTDFEIESVRLVFRREHLAELPSGIGWQGLSEAYREVVVARAPEKIRWQVSVPERPSLELALGTLDDRPVTFRVSLGDQDLMTRTLTTPFRWDVVDLDLAASRSERAPTYPAGRRVTLTLALESASPGILGLWGAPALRRRVEPAAASSTAGRGSPQGVLFILADTLRPDRLDAYGHSRATAPTLSRIADEGTRFLDTVAQGTWTKVSAPSIMTSRYLTTTGVRDFADRLPATVTTLAEVYREAGYATVGYASVPFTGSANNLHQGYEELHERTFQLDASKTARGYVDRLLPWLERHRDVPFFVFLHVFDPHSPYEPASPFNTLWGDSAELDEHRRQKEAVRQHIQEPLRKLNTLPTIEELDASGVDPEVYIGRELDWYDGSIWAMDLEIGRVFERLRELGLDDRTLVVFASDHGEEFLDHGRMFHAQSVYGELVQVPMVFWYPGTVAAGVEVEETVQLIDLMPTLLELSGLPVPEGIQGQSAVPLLLPGASDRRWQPRPAISEKPEATSPFVPPPIDTEATSVIFEGWKLIHNTKRPDDKAEYELFDHRNDPQDQADVADQHPEVVTRLAGVLDSWRAKAEGERLESEADAAEGMSQEDLERLRALGYVQ